MVFVESLFLICSSLFLFLKHLSHDLLSLLLILSLFIQPKKRNGNDYYLYTKAVREISSQSNVKQMSNKNVCLCVDMCLVVCEH